MDVLRARQAQTPFSLAELNGTQGGTPTGLKKAIKMPLLTYPVVVIKGRWVGGADDLHRLAAADDAERGNAAGEGGEGSSSRCTLSRMVAAERPTASSAPTVGWASNLTELAAPQLLHPPRDGRWWFFQLHTYTNVVRLLAAFHLLLGVVSLALAETGHPVGAAAVLWYLFVDTALYIVTGCPLSPLSALATWWVWARRGNTTSVLPYKFTFCIYIYFFLGQGVLACPSGLGAACTRQYDDAYRGMLLTLIGNSALLAILRF
jgi:hypothetical protein